MRISIETDDFKSYGETVINELRDYTENHGGWEVVPDNFEGIRVACDKNNGAGWFLLRLSLHDPVIPLNIESERNGGVKDITDILINFLSNFEYLNLSSFNKLK